MRTILTEKFVVRIALSRGPRIGCRWGFRLWKTRHKEHINLDCRGGCCERQLWISAVLLVVLALVRSSHDRWSLLIGVPVPACLLGLDGWDWAINFWSILCWLLIINQTLSEAGFDSFLENLNITFVHELDDLILSVAHVCFSLWTKETNNRVVGFFMLWFDRVSSKSAEKNFRYDIKNKTTTYLQALKNDRIFVVEDTCRVFILQRTNVLFEVSAHDHHLILFTVLGDAAIPGAAMTARLHEQGFVLWLDQELVIVRSCTHECLEQGLTAILYPQILPWKRHGAFRVLKWLMKLLLLIAMPVALLFFVRLVDTGCFISRRSECWIFFDGHWSGYISECRFDWIWRKRAGRCNCSHCLMRKCKWERSNHLMHLIGLGRVACVRWYRWSMVASCVLILKLAFPISGAERWLVMLLELRLRASELSLCLVALFKYLLHIRETHMIILVWRAKFSALNRSQRRFWRAACTGWIYFCDCSWLNDLLRVVRVTHMIHLLINNLCLGGKWFARDYSILHLVHLEKFVSIKKIKEWEVHEAKAILERRSRSTHFTLTQWAYATNDKLIR